MNPNINTIEEVNNILSRYRKGDISADFAKTELLYLIKGAKSMAELRVAQAVYDQLSIRKNNLDDTNDEG